MKPEVVGVPNAVPSYADAKRLLLFFNKIAVDYDDLKDGPLMSARIVVKDALKPSELQWLSNNNLVHPYSKLDASFYGIERRNSVLDVQSFLFATQFNARHHSAYLREEENLDSYPIVDFAEFSERSKVTQQQEVLEIVINNLPTPDESVPWEAIIDYRNDERSTHLFLALKRWMRKIGKEELSKVEIEEELKHLIEEYRQHMRLHKMKAQTGTLKTLVSVPLEIIEDLIKIRWSKIVQKLFLIREQQASLLEAELKAPGREVAYMVEAANRFAGKKNAGK